MNDEENRAELAEPVFDEFILTQLPEAAEAEDRLQRAKYELRQIQAEAEDRERFQADDHFARLRRQFPSATPEQICSMIMDPEPEQFAINAVET
jgi:hypothetical protein